MIGLERRKKKLEERESHMIFLMVQCVLLALNQEREIEKGVSFLWYSYLTLEDKSLCWYTGLFWLEQIKGIWFLLVPLNLGREDAALQNLSLKRFVSGTIKTNNNKPLPRSQTTAWPGWSSYALYMLSISYSELTWLCALGQVKRLFQIRKSKRKKTQNTRSKL